MNIYIFKYNNYYNRQFKRSKTIAGHGSYIHFLSDVKDFTPNDGVNTEHVFGSPQTAYYGAGDYLLVTENDLILSRWFIIESRFTRNGQWRLTLHRDLIADYYEEIVDAPCFIEKATLNIGSPFIFNNENMSFNQIKTSETLLKDKSGCPWLVGYYSKDKTLEGTVPTNTIDDIPFIALPGSLSQWEFYKNSDKNPSQVPFKGVALSGEYNFVGSYVSATGSQTYEVNYAVDIFTGAVRNPTNVPSLTTSCFKSSRVGNSAVQSAFESFGLGNLNYSAYSGTSTQAKLNELLSYSGQTIKDTSTGKYYNVYITPKNVTTTISIPSGALYNNFGTILRPLFTSYTPDNKSFSLTVSYTEYSLKLEDLPTLSLNYSIGAEKLITTDAPWNIFAIPYGEINVKTSAGATLISTNKINSITAAMAMQAQHPSEIYDIQLLPYCPIQSLITGDKEITVTNANQYTLIQKEINNETAGIIFHVPYSNFTFDITSFKKAAGKTAIEKKLNNECDKWRLTSPNYSNYFDFSVEKNNGIEYFNVDCNYKPFTPYVHINPKFGGLYGYDDNSPRGLVLGGDFSLSQIIDQWEQYQVQNKNFQAIFDRQIQSMELKNNLGRTQDVVGAIAGVGQGAAAGALTGSMIGPMGAAIGGAVGGVASAIGGIADIAINEQLRNDALDYTKDMFGYQLGNIQALPHTISKVSAFNENNKIFPILEYYTCTDQEKIALLNKIAWNGMTVMTIGTINDYINNSWSYGGYSSKNYIKGKLIRISGINDEYHLLKNISDEINKGVYF